jgi:type IV pilus assembly protein PilB
MSEEINSPLLSLIQQEGMIDDLQYEGVVAEHKRNATPVIQILQDFGIMKLDDILQLEAHALGTEVVSLRDRELPPEVLGLVPLKVAQMYNCVPVGAKNGTVQIALSEPLDPSRPDEIQFARKRSNDFTDSRKVKVSRRS